MSGGGGGGKTAWLVLDERSGKMSIEPKDDGDQTMPPPISTEPLWNQQQCARYLGRCIRWVYDARHNGNIPHVMLPNGSPRFVPADIALWVRQGCPPASVFEGRKKGGG